MTAWADSLALRASRALARVAPSAPRNPVFLISCGRSGTSMLRRRLARHADLAVYPSEANDLWHPNLYPWHSKRVNVPAFWSDPERFTRISQGSTTDGQWRRLVATFGHFHRLARGRLFLNKSAMIHFMLDRVTTLFPDARFVHVVRDGRAVSLSWMRRIRRLDAGRGYGPADDLDDAEMIEHLMRYWATSVETIDRYRENLSLGTDRFLELRYEDLCTDPASSLAGLGDFLGVDSSASLTTDPSAYIDQNAKARSLARAQLDHLTEIGAAALASRSYSLSEVGPEGRVVS